MQEWNEVVSYAVARELMNTLYTNTLFSNGALKQDEDFFLMLSFSKEERNKTFVFPLALAL